MKHILLLIIFLLLTSINALSQKVESAYKGTHFYVGFMQNEIDWHFFIVGKLVLKIHIVAEQNANILVNMPLESTLHTISADSILVINVKDGMEIIQSEIISNKLVEIISDVPVVVYCFNSRHQTSDSYAAIPISRWGKEYVTVNYSNDQYNYTNDSDKDFALTPRSSEFLIMAAFDNTLIEFIPKSVTRGNKQYNIPYYITLNAGEAYLVQSFAADKGYGDLTGSIIKSSQPIGVLSGHVRTSIPNTIGADSKDHLCEMLMPIETWGKKFVSVPFNVNNMGDLFRVVSGYENTIVSYKSKSNQGSIELNKPGNFKEFTNAFEPILWEANRPVQIAQYMKRFGGPYDPEDYDPCLVILPPVEQFVNRLLFQVPEYDIAAWGQFNNHYVMIIASEDAIATMKVNNTSITSLDNIYNNKILNEKLFWARFELKPGKYILSCEEGGFTGILYGKGNRDSYAHVLGASLVNLNAADTIAPEIFVTENCGKISGYIREYINLGNKGIDFAEVVKSQTYNYNWTITPIKDTTTFVYFTAEPINPLEDGSFALDYRDRAGNGGRYVFEYNGIKLDIPKEILFEDIESNDSTCKTITVRNTGKGNIFITRFRFSGSFNSSYECNADFPKELVPGETFRFTVCYIPRGDTTRLNAKIDIGIQCLDDIILPIKGNIKLPEMIITSYDYGKILVGRDTCAEISVINSGTLPITIDSLNIPDNIRFFYQGNVRFPLRFYQGQSFTLRFCFNPDSIGPFDAVISTYNDYNLDASSTLTGLGSYQEINNITIDWLKRRVGTLNDTSSIMANTGDFIAYVTFDKFIENSSVFYTESISELLDFPIDVGETYELDFGFYAAEPRKYEATAIMKTDWLMHPDISVHLIGEGTLPQIKVFDVIMDTTVIFHRRDSICKIIDSDGNEILTIDSIFFGNGDDNSFIFDYSPLKNIQLESGNNLKIPIAFIPQKLGWNEVTLKVVHDAMPAYQRDTAYILVKGFAIPDDTLKATLDLDIPFMLSCVKEKVYPEIKNTGNITLEFRKSPSIATTGGLTARIIKEPAYPFLLAPDDTLTYELELLPYGSEEKTIELKQTAYGTNGDSAILNVFRRFSPEMKKITINPVSILKSKPGDTINVEISGVFPYGIDTTTNFKLEIDMKMSNFLLLSQNSYIKIVSGENKLTYPLEIRQESNKLILSCNENFSFLFKTNWELNFQLLTLLDDIYEDTLKCTVASELCFLADSSQIQVEVASVCVKNLRLISRITETPWLEINPSPVQDKMKVNLFLPESETVNLSLFDINGKKYSLLENKYLKKGEYSLIFENLTLQSGIYFIRMTTENSVESKKLIILK